MSIDVSGKRLGLFKELVPNLSRIAIMLDPRDARSTYPRWLREGDESLVDFDADLRGDHARRN